MRNLTVCSNRGTQLRENLTARWRVDGSYAGARVIVSGALLQGHSSSRFGGPTAPGFDLADVAAIAVAYGG
jgi:hypothetical protein